MNGTPDGMGGLLRLPDVMIDLETLGTGDNSPIIQMAAVRFTYEGTAAAPRGMVSTPEGGFCRNIVADDWRGIEPATLLWWLHKDRAVARARVFEQRDAVPLVVALQELRAWVLEQGPVERIWADGPAFDLRLLRQAHARVGLVGVWESFCTHRMERDVRTLTRLPGADALKPIRVGVEHDALDDAHHQALWVVNLMQGLRFSFSTTAPQFDGAPRA